VETLLELGALKDLKIKYRCPATLQTLRIMFAETFDKVLNAK
jgi:hypothetical protein